MDLEKIKLSIKSENFRITLHAVQEKENDKLRINEILESVVNGEVIENYPFTKPFPSCLILGFNKEKEPIHSVIAFDKITQRVILVTVYRPSVDKWVEYRKRK